MSTDSHLTSSRAQFVEDARTVIVWQSNDGDLIVTEEEDDAARTSIYRLSDKLDRSMADDIKPGTPLASMVDLEGYVHVFYANKEDRLMHVYSPRIEEWHEVNVSDDGGDIVMSGTTRLSAIHHVTRYNESAALILFQEPDEGEATMLISGDPLSSESWRRGDISWLTEEAAAWDYLGHAMVDEWHEPTGVEWRDKHYFLVALEGPDGEVKASECTMSRARTDPICYDSDGDELVLTSQGTQLAWSRTFDAENPDLRFLTLDAQGVIRDYRIQELEPREKGTRSWAHTGNRIGAMSGMPGGKMFARWEDRVFQYELVDGEWEGEGYLEQEVRG
ncbi:hypothetical protein B0I35DRAFT_476571 [Stachybotrys elegans]|uniref:Fucose-specific lectin n=1 Tax=Stachybotrys elegans TaxID=80388 RepID=A0A8K0SYY1_9HYPO|nr:hypothetical protein B0I35DRAFT_476571 [Stachybotrys elegans]